MKTFALGLPLLTALGLFALRPSPVAPPSPVATPSPVAPPSPVATTGVLSGWELEMDGSLYLRLRTEENSDEEVWFETPPDRSTALNTEEMVLQIVLHTGTDELLTLVAENDPRQDGSSRDRARELMALRGD